MYKKYIPAVSLFFSLLLALSFVNPAHAAAGDARIIVTEDFGPNFAEICNKDTGEGDCSYPYDDTVDINLYAGSTKTYHYQLMRADGNAFQTGSIDLDIIDLQPWHVTGSGVGWTSGAQPSCSFNSSQRKYTCTASGNTIAAMWVVVWTSGSLGGQVCTVTTTGIGTRTVVPYQDMLPR